MGLEEKFYEVHKGFYDYTQVIYNGMLEKINILCPLHGVFQMTPDKHLRGTRCPKCASIERGLNKTSKARGEFFSKVLEIHGGKYNYDIFNYTNSYTKSTVVCLKHGNFEITPNNHLQGVGCSICGVESTSILNSLGLEDILERCINSHGGDNYDYSLITNYINSHSVGVILCKKHGPFVQNIYQHANGKECPSCRVFINGFSIDRYKGKIPVLYYVKLNDIFYKIGLSVSPIEVRFAREKVKIEVIQLWEFDNSKKPWELEKIILKRTKDYKITKEESPIMGGYTEVRSIDIYDIIVEEIEKYEN